eukprot:scaffold193_cov255-Pinguiococcus_pyrenoidosus.AAC.1
MAHNFYRGLNVQQDSRFGSTDKKLLRKMRFDAALYKKKVDMKRVNVEVMKQWVKETITDLLGFEDDIVTGLVDAMLEADEAPDPKNMQLQLTGFLEKKVRRKSRRLRVEKVLEKARRSGGSHPTQMSFGTHVEFRGTFIGRAVRSRALDSAGRCAE